MYLRNAFDYLKNAAVTQPQKCAVCDESRSFTYAEFYQSALAIGSFLAAQGIEPNAPVAILADRQAVALAAMQGTLAAGNHYVILDRAMPAQRLQQILQTVQPPMVLYLEGEAPEIVDSFPHSSIEQAMEHPIDEALLAQRRNAVLDTDPAYVIFTSGSTGTPKGILIPHRALIDFTEWLVEACALTGSDRYAAQAPLYFDLSVKSIYPVFKTAATVHLLPKKFFAFPMLLTRYIKEHQLNVAMWATSAFHLVANSGVLEKDPPCSLNCIALGGEALQAKQLRRWQNAVDARYFNLYGPTEVTVDCTYYPIDHLVAEDDPIPIGRACENKGVFLLNEQNQLAAIGEVGELCVRGAGLACGYLNEPEKNAAAFTQNPLNTRYPERIYRTGDLAVLKEDGNFYFRARKDHQIKHMGYRIELGEIETALSAIGKIQAAICLFDETRDKILCIYQGALTAAELASELQKSLPKYMIPNRYEAVDRMPYTPNGKIDRAALKGRYL